MPLSGVAAFAQAVALERTGLDRPTQSIQVTRNDGGVVKLLLGSRSRGEAPPPPMRPGQPPPPSDTYRYAKLAQSLGWYGEGPITNPNDLGPALARAIAVVKKGQPALVDVVTQPR